MSGHYAAGRSAVASVGGAPKAVEPVGVDCGLTVSTLTVSTETVNTRTERRLPDAWIRPVNAGLAILGVLVTHETAYSLASALPLNSDVVPEHGHQAVLWTVGVPLALWAITAFILRQAAQLGVVATIPRHRLGAAVAGLYLVQETAELLIQGNGPAGLVANRAVLIGLLLAPLVAGLLLRLLAFTSEIVAGWLATEPPPEPEAAVFGPAPRPAIHRWLAVPGDPRGPPIEFVPSPRI